jgi:hypothetical protein
MGRDCVSESVPIALAEADQRTPAKASAESPSRSRGPTPSQRHFFGLRRADKRGLGITALELTRGR